MGIIIFSQHNEPRKQDNARKGLGRRRAQKASAKGKKNEVCSVGGIASKDDSGFLKNKTKAPAGEKKSGEKKGEGRGEGGEGKEGSGEEARAKRKITNFFFRWDPVPTRLPLYK